MPTNDPLPSLSPTDVPEGASTAEGLIAHTLAPPQDANTDHPSIAPDTGTLHTAGEIRPPTDAHTPPISYTHSPDSRKGTLPNIPGYVLLDELGRGGMGVVYKAQQKELKRLVALKMILGSAGTQERTRFKDEAEAIARLQHPGIVQIYEVGEFQGQPYCALEFVEGGSLDHLIKGTPQPAREAAQLVRTLCLAVHAANEKNIIHRDLKPANVLLANGGRESPELNKDSGGLRPPLANATPKITDFGLAKKLDDDSGQTRAGSIMGTPSYMAPEQAEGAISEIGSWTDSYALGAILYELLTGRPPFKGQTVWETLDLVRGQDPVAPRQLQPKTPRDLETICLKALQKKPRSRYLTARELGEDLDRYLEGRPILARPVSRTERLVKWVRRSPLQAAALVATLVVIAMGVAMMYVGMESAKKDAQLSRINLDETERKLKEQRRQSDLRREFDDLSAQARVAEEAEQWSKVERLTDEALKLVKDPAFADFAPREPIQLLNLKAQGFLKSDKERMAERAKQDVLKQHHGNAVFFSTLFTGLELADNFERVRDAVRQGLAIFKIEADGKARIDLRFFKPAEVQAIIGLTYEMLLMEAEALAQIRSGEKQTPNARLDEALTLLDRADRLGLEPIQSGLHCRAEILDKLGKKEEAEQIRKKAEGFAPSLAGDFFLKGMTLYREGEYRKAIVPLTTALQKLPDHYGAEYLLAVCRLREAEFEEVKGSHLRETQLRAAERGLSHCLDMRPDFAWPRLLRGFVEMELGNPKEAREDFEIVLKTPPDEMARYVALVNRGVLGVKQRDWDNASADFKQAIGLKPEAFAAYLNLAILHKRRAEMEWRVPLPPGSVANPLLTVGLTVWKRSEYQAAVESLDKAIERRDNVATLYKERGRLHVLLGSIDAARQDFARAIVLAPAESVRLVADLVDVGRLLLEGQSHLQALAIFDAVLKLRPDHAMALRMKAQCLLALDRYPQAGETLDAYLAIAPEKTGKRTPEETRRLIDSYLSRGLIHEKANDHRLASECYTRGLESERDLRLLSRRGWSYLMTGAAALAKADFDEVLTRRPRDGDALLGRADARIKLGEWKAALEDADKGVQLSLNTTRTNYNAARVHAQAYTRFSDAERQTRSRLVETDRARERCVELLRAAILSEPLESRTTFWRLYVERDPVMSPLARQPDLLRLASELRIE